MLTVDWDRKVRPYYSCVTKTSLVASGVQGPVQDLTLDL